MLKSEIQEKLDNSIYICSKHIERIQYAVDSLSDIFPLTVLNLKELTDGNVSLIDQFIFRFSKLQDEIGNKLFRFVLILLGENIEGLAFRDILNKLEKLSIIESTSEWLNLREIRNDLSHEYPESEEQQIKALNLIFSKYQDLIQVFNNCKNTVEKYR